VARALEQRRRLCPCPRAPQASAAGLRGRHRRPASAPSSGHLATTRLRLGCLRARSPSGGAATDLTALPRRGAAGSTGAGGNCLIQIIRPLSLASLHKVQVWFQGRSFPDTGHVLTLGLPHRLGELARLRAPGAIWRDGAEVAAGAPARSRPGAVHHGGRDGKRGGVQDFGEQPAG
jgi:hypothetical protein